MTKIYISRDINDTNITNPQNGEALIFFNGEWINQIVSGSNVSISGSDLGPTGFLELDDTPDSYAGEAGKVAVVNQAQNGIEFVAYATDLNDLNDIDINSPSNKEVLTFRDGNWVNQVISGSDHLHVGDHTHIESEITDLSHDAALIQGQEVSANIPQQEDFLIFRNSEWIPSIISGSSHEHTFLDLSDSPSSYTGNSGKAVVVNETATGLIFSTIQNSGTGTGGTAGDYSDYIDGTLIAGSDMGGVFIVPRDCTIQNVMIHCKDTGTSGSTMVDVNKNGTTIFTTQANRPSILYNDANGYIISEFPDVTSLVQGDILTFDIDEVAEGAESLTIMIAMDVVVQVIGSASDCHWFIDGSLSSGSDIGETFIIPRDATITNVYISCKDTGTSGSTIIDVHLNGTTIFTTQANRPILSFDDANKVAKSGLPDVISLSENDLLRIDIDQVATGAKNLSVLVTMNINNGTLGDLLDVDLTGIVDGETIIWDEANSKFIPGASGGSGLTFPITRTYVSNIEDGIVGYVSSNGTFNQFNNQGLTTLWATPRWIVSQINVYSGQGAWRAIDGSADVTTSTMHTENTLNAWWKIDFGASYTLTPNYVGIVGRSSSGTHVRNFKIQGSNNDTDWTDLLTVVSDGPGDGTWWSSAITGSSAYRYIRLYNTGVNSDGNYYYTMGEIEFWGTLAEV